MNRNSPYQKPLAGLLALSLLGACADADWPGQDRATTLTILYSPGDYRFLTPLAGLGSMHLVYSPLFGPAEDGQAVPGLVRAWEHSEDFREWTYHLRTDVRWHDGAPLSAHDVKFTYDLYSHPAVARRRPDAQTITVLDDSTFVVVRHTPSGLAVDDWNVILPRHIFGDLDPGGFFEWEAWTHPIGTGPYRFVRYEERVGIEVEANPDYYLGKPRIDRIVLKLGGTVWADLESGAVDADVSGEPETLFRLDQDPRFKMYWSVGPGICVLWNQRSELFRDARVRKALTHSIDRAALATVLNYPSEYPLIDFPATPAQASRGEYPDPYPFDPTLARNLLGEAGWRDEDGDGVIERAGEEFRFTLLTGSAYEAAAVFLKDQFLRVGVEAEIEPVDNSLWRTRMRAGHYDGTISGFDLRFILPESEDLPGAGYENTDLRRILAERDASFDPTADEQAYRAMWPIFQREHPVTPLIPRPRFSIAHVRVKGLQSPNRVWPDRHAAQLWIEEEG